MKRLLYVMLLGLLVLANGCEKNEGVAHYKSTEQGRGKERKTTEETLPDNIVCEEDSSYNVKELENSQCHVELAAGTCVYQDQILMCDQEGDKLVFLDKNLNFVKEMKKFEPDDEELFQPTGITVFHDKLYIIDSGNSRILVLNSEYQIEESIELEVVVGAVTVYRYIDLAIDKDGIIYICTNSNMANAHIYVIENGEMTEIKQEFYGHLVEKNGEVYALESMEVGGADEYFVSSVASGTNCLYQLKKTKMKKIKELPYKMTPSDFVFVGDKLITISTAYTKLYQFSEEYEPEKSFVDVETDDETYITRINDTDFLLTDASNGKIFYVYH